MELRSMAEALQSKFEPEPDGDMKTVGLYSLAGERSEVKVRVAATYGDLADYQRDADNEELSDDDSNPGLGPDELWLVRGQAEIRYHEKPTNGEEIQYVRGRFPDQSLQEMLIQIPEELRSYLLELGAKELPNMEMRRVDDTMEYVALVKFVYCGLLNAQALDLATTRGLSRMNFEAEFTGGVLECLKTGSEEGVSCEEMLQRLRDQYA
eukprot:CAMPEP_0181509160 /NCGR_PEP_ID=MMETSP1110-20121109/60187_1 /TAXON_ID=174948 /ORGANISM="Symbiodinium sp., Strain CCMP421" /LENGTH=208 /DNA_ID=CAMNT_0023638681 /DNA_START=47 /DNA_END=673 /DNA_ORIENTATION=+